MNEIKDAMLKDLSQATDTLDVRVRLLLTRGIDNLFDKVDKYRTKGIDSLSTQDLAMLKGASESSVSSVKKTIANGNGEYDNLDDWLLGTKKQRETKSRERTKQALQKMDKNELVAMLAGLGIEVK